MHRQLYKVGKVSHLVTTHKTIDKYYSYSKNNISFVHKFIKCDTDGVTTKKQKHVNSLTMVDAKEMKIVLSLRKSVPTAVDQREFQETCVCCLVLRDRVKIVWQNGE